jgi:hypothetical protein
MVAYLHPDHFSTLTPAIVIKDFPPEISTGSLENGCHVGIRKEDESNKTSHFISVFTSIYILKQDFYSQSLTL